MNWFVDRVLGFFVENFPSWKAIAIAAAALVSDQITVAHGGFLKILLIAGASTLAEAVSSHGWDNATMQVVPTALVWLLMT